MAKKTRGRPKKAVTEEIIEAEETIKTPEPQISDAEIVSTKEVTDLRNLYNELLRRGINTLSTLEVKIQQEETNLQRIKDGIRKERLF